MPSLHYLVIKSFQAELAKAKKRLAFYRGLLKHDAIDEQYKAFLNLTVEQHLREVKMYRRLLVRARRHHADLQREMQAILRGQHGADGRD